MVNYWLRQLNDFIFWESRLLNSLTARQRREFNLYVAKTSLARLKFSFLTKILLSAGVILSVAFLYEEGEDTKIFVWAFAMIAISLVQKLFVAAFQLLKKKTGRYARSMINVENAFLCLTAIGFGILPYNFWPAGNLAHELIILCILVIYSGWASELTLGFSRISILNSALALFPMIWCLLTHPSAVGLWGALFLISYFLYLCWRTDAICRREANQIIEKIETRTVYADARAKTRELLRVRKASSDHLLATSHDLRQPIYAAKLLASTLEELHPENIEVRKDLTRKLNLSLSSMEEMLDGLLSFSLLKSGRLKVRQEICCLNSIAQDLSNEFSVVAQKNNVQLVIEDLPFLVHSDGPLLSRLLRNLLANAIRYSPNEIVNVSAEMVDQELVLEVRDTGPGIPGSEQDLIFLEFQSFKRKGVSARESLGLGLAIVKRIARILGLSVSVSSSTGEGTCFRVSFPSHLVEEQIHTPSQFFDKDALPQD